MVPLGSEAMQVVSRTKQAALNQRNFLLILVRNLNLVLKI